MEPASRLVGFNSMLCLTLAMHLLAFVAQTIAFEELFVEDIVDSAHHKLFSYMMNTSFYEEGQNNTFHSKRVMATGVSHIFHANSSLLPVDCDKNCVSRARTRRVMEHLRATWEQSRKYSVSNRISHVWLNRQKIVEWYVELPVTSPSTPTLQLVRLVPDTGSFFTWFQCKPCETCWAQRTRLFDPVINRATFRYLTDRQDFCQRVQGTDYGGGANSGACYHDAYYADGTESKGLVSTDTFRFWSFDGQEFVYLPGIGFGCGLENKSPVNTGMAGVMGLARFHQVSISEQTFRWIGSSFSYCLPIVGSAENSGWIVFGDDAMPDPSRNPGYSAIPFPNAGAADTYYLDAIDMHVNGQRVYLPPGIFDIQQDGSGGVVIDSGALMSTLMPAAYGPFRQKYRSEMRPILGDVRFGGKFGMDTCYDVTGIDVPRLALPTIGFHLRNGQQLTFGRIASYFQYESNSGRPILCLFWIAQDTSPEAVSVFGGYSQMQMHMSFQFSPPRLIWANDKC